MDLVPSIVSICWNRLEYLQRTVPHMLADPSDFRWYFWDNASDDDTRDFINDLKDDRIVAKHFHKENVRQYEPWFWFLENCKGDIAGKLDDDILGPAGWPERFARIIAQEEKIGLMGGWVYLPEDWDEAQAAHKIVTVGEQRVFQNTWVAGCIFLGRKTLLERYSPRAEKFWGMPVNHAAITRAGYISGYPLPIPFAENLDDPRNPHCRMNRPGGWDEYAAFTARMRNFSGPEEYGRWIADDARLVLRSTIAEQLNPPRPSLIARAKGKLKRMMG